jgi:membrane-associated phospholipid phosphatase
MGFRTASALALGLAIEFLSPSARACEPPRPGPRTTSPTPIDRLGCNTIDAFTGTGALLSGLAVASTAGFAISGADHSIRVFFGRHAAQPSLGASMALAGYVAPVVIPLLVYGAGLSAKDGSTTGAGAAAIQALAVTVTTTALLKVASGRPFPLYGGDPRDPARFSHPEYAREFRPFSFEGRYAWPSGHTSAAVSVAAAFSGYFADEHPWMPLATYPVALAFGVGMMAGDHHWASDVVAGALIGHAVGYSIGRNFGRMGRGGAASDSGGVLPMMGEVRVLPMMGEVRGVQLFGTF